MNAEAAIVFTGTAVVSGTALTAVVLDRYRKKLAALVTLAAGLCPWLLILGFKGVLRGEVCVGLGLFGATPLFAAAFFLFGIGQKSRGTKVAAGIVLAGMFLSIGLSMFWFHLLSKME
jgi:hypothetical protein